MQQNGNFRFDMKRAVFLDRDGVLNRSFLVDGVPRPPTSVGDIEILAGVIEAIQILKNHDLVPVVVTNQADVARGGVTQSQVEAINARIGDATKIEFFYTCFHDDDDLCDCRKPSPGLIYRASRELDLSVQGSFLVGDRWRDISAGQAAGCQTFFIDYSYPEKRPEMPYTTVYSLLEAVLILTGDPNAAK
jgi:D-glycero-D-manno-heptose 1,7-bisphosphate phosphatase